MPRNLLILLLLLFSAGLPATFATGDGYSIVPAPVSLKPGTGSMGITAATPVLFKGGEEAGRIAAFFTDRVSLSGGPQLKAEAAQAKKGVPSLVFELDPSRKSIPPEGYEIRITPSGGRVRASSGAGLFRAVQTLFQLLPPAIHGDTTPGITDYRLPSVTIRDHPRYPYRGMHLDVSRHFFPKEFVKKYIDLIAMYRMNTFHWHLTDDNGWRIEIKKYPLLTETGAWRVDREDLPWGERPAQSAGEKATYGGFYTQDDIREIVAYAAARYITVIPEIEMPAHSIEVLAAYPGLSCTGGPFTVPPGSYWPNSDILCAGNDSVFTFLEDVLSEVIALFPSAYVHAGGDEADKTNWKKCPKCQARMQREGLADEKELQSWFMRQADKILRSKGRKMIVWDEILEGGLAEDATVMSWRGIDGGITAARLGHDVIMTPVSHCYLDYYQADPEFEPKAIGGFTTLKKVYLFEPTPAELDAAEARHILGTQGNLWTEFVATPGHAEYMAVPRMIALAEVAWTPRKQKDWAGFRLRLDDQFKRLDRMGVRYSRGSFRVAVHTVTDPKSGQVSLVLDSEQPAAGIRYTLNGDEVTDSSTPFQAPVPVSANGVVRAAVFADGKLMEKAVEMPLIYHKAIGKPVRYITRYSGRYPASGDATLTDGLRGPANHREGQWLGFQGQDAEVIIDLGKEMPVSSVQVNFLRNQRSWIFLPSLVEYSLSADGKNYHSFNEVPDRTPSREERTVIQPFNFQFRQGTTARYIRMKAKNPGPCPEWHEGAGQPCWIFTDEIVVF